MSAIKDPEQATTFIYSNFYQLYRTEKLKEKLEKLKQKEVASGVVLKSRSITEAPSLAEVSVVSAEQADEFRKWAHEQTSTGKKDMATHLKSVREARKRRVYLMNELNELLNRE